MKLTYENLSIILRSSLKKAMSSKKKKKIPNKEQKLLA